MKLTLYNDEKVDFCIWPLPTILFKSTDFKTIPATEDLDLLNLT